ncbi:MAG: hypothetical protein ACI4EF_11710 [Coprococcus sp.]
MSQSKVERRKYEKKNRAAIMKKQKIKKAAAITLTVIIILGIFGGTVGYQIYKAMPKYVKADKLESVVENTWKSNGYEGILPATATDAEEETAGEDTSDAEDTSSEDTSSEEAAPEENEAE